MWNLLKKLHLSLRARFVSHWQKREVLKVVRQMHARDFEGLPIRFWPMVQAQQEAEIAGIKAGKLANIVDRRSQANVGIPYTMNRLNLPVPKQAPISLRRYARTPVVSRAINLIKAGLLALPWEIEPMDEADKDDPDVQARIKIATDCFEKPNNDDSFREWTEAGTTDFLIYGAFCSEMQATPHDERPVKMWVVDASTIQIVVDWKEVDADTLPRYAQVAPGTATAMQPIPFMNDEMLYIRDNVASDTPFGTGCAEVAYRAIGDLINVQRMAGVAGADQIGRNIFWWNAPYGSSQTQELREYLQSEMEGMARVGIISGVLKPEVVKIDPVQIQDLLLEWQEMCIRMIAAAFNLSPLALNITEDVNKAVGSVMADQDFRSAVVPIAKRLQEAFTRNIIHVKMGFEDLRFKFQGTEDPDMETKITMLESLYNMGVVTPNDIAVKCGLKKSKSPFADLTMQEFLLLQAQMQQIVKSTQMQPGQDDPNAQGPTQGPFGQQAGLADSNQTPDQNAVASLPSLAPRMPKATLKVAKLPKLKQPKLSAPKLKHFSAATIAQMSKAQIHALRMMHMVPSSVIRMAGEMEDEEPGVLQQLSEEVWEYLDHLADHEVEQAQEKNKAKLNKKWEGLAAKRYGQNKRRFQKALKDRTGPMEASAAKPSTARGRRIAAAKSKRNARGRILKPLLTAKDQRF